MGQTDRQTDVLRVQFVMRCHYRGAHKTPRTPLMHREAVKLAIRESTNDKRRRKFGDIVWICVSFGLLRCGPAKITEDGVVSARSH